jgi:hypothetical protein
VCRGSACRTVEVEGATFEASPERLIVRAALVAAAALLDDNPDRGRDEVVLS